MTESDILCSYIIIDKKLNPALNVILKFRNGARIYTIFDLPAMDIKDSSLIIACAIRPSNLFYGNNFTITTSGVVPRRIYTRKEFVLHLYYNYKNILNILVNKNAHWIYFLYAVSDAGDSKSDAENDQDEYSAADMRRDMEYFVRHNPRVLAHFKPKFQTKHALLSAVKRDGLALRYADRALLYGDARSNEQSNTQSNEQSPKITTSDILSAAIQQNPYAIFYIPPDKRSVGLRALACANDRLADIIKFEQSIDDVSAFDPELWPGHPANETGCEKCRLIEEI